MLLLLAPLSTCQSTRAEPTLALEVSLHGRGLVPGEPARIRVRSPEPLSSLRCRFLDQDVFMASAEDGRAWSGWALVALDQSPTGAVVEVDGQTPAGRPAAGTRALAIEAKEFPEERLEVESRYVTPPAEVLARLADERQALDAIYRARTERAPLSVPFVRPVPGEQTSVFGTRRILNGEPRSPHPGIDLRGAEGVPVQAPGPGRVVLARNLYYSGNTVILDHGGGLVTLYAHLSRIDVAVGDEVEPGDRVGLVGATGRVTGPHLHWGAKIGERPFDPSALLDPVLFE
jgi:murein DD-endopeptidase MepM/ murein hydrolase activator NlpD